MLYQPQGNNVMQLSYKSRFLLEKNTLDWHSSWETIKNLCCGIACWVGHTSGFLAPCYKVEHNMNYAWVKYCAPALTEFQGILLVAGTNLTWAVPLRAVYIHKEGYRRIWIMLMNKTGGAKAFVICGGEQWLLGDVCSLLIGDRPKHVVNFNSPKSVLRSPHTL